MAETQINSKIIESLINQGLEDAFSYQEYRELVAELAENGKSTGPEQSEALANYTQLNNRRMKRWDKTLKFNDEALSIISKVKTKITWLVLTESWCGDASPALPVMNKIAELNQNITLKIILRDTHIDLMNQFLTNGGMSIPKLIAIDDTTQEVLYDWGPRSKAATKLVEDHKLEHGEILPEFKEEIQVWYNKNKGQSILKDLTSLLLKDISNSAFL
ncbi:thioredoxin family protein [Aurantibacter crassamenti]|uniref:thioredoxin family protein n=1 Tax=Aurantibacter crassamenti TaxID=1837375 RepID=UPI00193AD6B6|nr:thioredoxin family protein [Aurantibacter crassamenti]MBM1104810.1 thioredoxin family protein [Aurantibacter crassamenti]